VTNPKGSVNSGSKTASSRSMSSPSRAASTSTATTWMSIARRLPRSRTSVRQGGSACRRSKKFEEPAKKRSNGSPAQRTTHPVRIFAARTVLCINIAMVIGPTRGHGRDQEAFADTRSKSTCTDEPVPFSAVLSSTRLMPTSITTHPPLPCRLLRIAARRCGIRMSADRQISARFPAARVADGHGGIGVLRLLREDNDTGRPTMRLLPNTTTLRASMGTWLRMRVGARRPVARRKTRGITQRELATLSG